MALVTQAEFARSHDVSRKTVTVWKAADLLVISEGKVDVEASDAILRDKKLGRFGEKVTKPAVGNNKAKEEQAPFERAPADLAEDILAGRFIRTSEAERVKENALALKQLVAARQAAGEVIEISEAEALFFEQARQERDAWQNWATRIAPMLAADLGVKADALMEFLSGYVQQHLAELGEPEIDFKSRG